MDTTPTTPARPNSPQNSDEIDLAQLGAALKRHSKLIAKVTGGTLLLTLIATLLQKPVWEGEFQIVLASKEGAGGKLAQFAADNPALASMAGLGGAGGKDALETEVQILQSPSVLKPVFDFVRTSKRQAGENIDKLRYEAWLKDNLEIKLQKGTSVLNIAYKDQDKDLITQVIKRISIAYQDYSGRDRRRSISLGVQYLDRQIDIYQAKSIASLRQAQEFAIENDLTALKDSNENDKDIRNSLNLEAIRIQAANEIRNIDEQLKQLRTLGNDPDAVMFRGLVIPELASKGAYQSLDDIDTQLTFLRSKYTEKEDSIRRLLERRRLLIGILKKQAYGYLLAKRASAQARLAASARPKGVLIKFRELLREAGRDEATLNKLEEQRQLLALEQARKEEPWELISTPTLLDRPVSPKKSRNMALGLLAGLVLGSGAALVVDRRSGKVFAIDELKASLPYPLLAELHQGVSQSNQQTLQLLAQGALEAPHSVALIPIGMDAAAAQPIATSLQSALREDNHNAEVLCSNNLLATRHCGIQILLTAPGAATRTELAALVQQLQLQGTPVAGWLLLQPSPQQAGDA